jgi:hypothetical protein
LDERRSIPKPKLETNGAAVCTRELKVKMWTHRHSVHGFLALVPAAALLAYTGDWPTGEGILTEISAQSVARFSEWSDAENVGPVVNSSFQDFLPNLSSDGLSLYFTSNRPGGMGGADLWVSQRASDKASWGEPVNLAMINTAGIESAPNLSRDGHYLFFSSTRPGRFGSNDIWVSRREPTDDDFAWEPPVNLGPNVNSDAFEAGASLLRPEFYFTSTRDSDPNLDIYVSRVVGNTFGPATPCQRVEQRRQRPASEHPIRRPRDLLLFQSRERGRKSGHLVRDARWQREVVGRSSGARPPDQHRACGSAALAVG